MYWIDVFGDGFAVWFQGEIIEICKTRKAADTIIEQLRSEATDAFLEKLRNE